MPEAIVPVFLYKKTPELLVPVFLYKKTPELLVLVFFVFKSIRIAELRATNCNSTPKSAILRNLKIICRFILICMAEKKSDQLHNQLNNIAYIVAFIVLHQQSYRTVTYATFSGIAFIYEFISLELQAISTIWVSLILTEIHYITLPGLSIKRSEYLYVKTVEYLISVKTEHLMAGSVIYQGLEENPWISKDELKGVVEKVVNLIKKLVLLK
ncbi:hypothetical protein RhiirC2_795410 [Rhizophagus irregularis]|uniref:Uncharacterized protein n=1 Tax=Rhizophagus irregularis TaxID=588596 RepID=A0A2N1MBQ5_9GLOM|nr:hypothetical protein RhiirC2_795410 [Rhizophagus irregularis]